MLVTLLVFGAMIGLYYLWRTWILTAAPKPRRRERPRRSAEVLDAWFWKDVETDTWWLCIRTPGQVFQETLPWVGR